MMRQSFFTAGTALSLALCTSAFAGEPSAAGFSYQSSRDSSVPVCAPSGQGLQNQTITFDSWSRTRATVTNLCFEVYYPGITDQVNASPSKLNVLVYAPYEFPARFVKKSGNNFVYLLDLRSFDPISHGIGASGNTKSTLVLDVYINPASTGSYTQGNSVSVKYTQ